MRENDRSLIPQKGQVGLLGTKYLIYVAIMDRAVEFYRVVIGLDVKIFSPYWSELTIGGATVALHGGRDSSFVETGLSFTVKDVFVACQAIVEGGGSLRSEPEDRGDEGIYLAMGTDTENNGIMISQTKESKPKN